MGSGSSGGGTSSGRSRWTLASGYPFGAPKGAVFDPQSANVFYLATEWGLAKTTDGGQTWVNLWQAYNGVVKIGALLMDPLSSNTLYVGTDRGVFKSTDGGATWANVSSTALAQLSVTALAAHPQTAGLVLAGTGNGIFKTTNGGASWTPANLGLGTLSINALTVEPNQPV